MAGSSSSSSYDEDESNVDCTALLPSFSSSSRGSSSSSLALLPLTTTNSSSSSSSRSSNSSDEDSPDHHHRGSGNHSLHKNSSFKGLGKHHHSGLRSGGSRTTTSSHATPDTEQLSLSEQLSASASSLCSSNKCSGSSHGTRGSSSSSTAGGARIMEELLELEEELLPVVDPRNAHKKSAAGSGTTPRRSLDKTCSSERLRHRRERGFSELLLDGGEDHHNPYMNEFHNNNNNTKDRWKSPRYYSVRSSPSSSSSSSKRSQNCCVFNNMFIRLFGIAVVLLVGMMGLCGFPFSSRFRGERQRQLQFHRRIQRNMKRISKFSIPTSFTILLRGSRLDLLQRSIDHHSQCPSVARMELDLMTHREELPESLLGHGRGKLVDTSLSSSSSSQTSYAHRIREAVFLLDESVQFTCAELDRGFRAWRSQPTSLVGLLPCRVCRYPLVSESAVFVHRLLLETETTSIMQSSSSSSPWMTLPGSSSRADSNTAELTLLSIPSSSSSSSSSFSSSPGNHHNHNNMNHNDPCAPFEWGARLASAMNEPPVTVLTNPVRTVIHPNHMDDENSDEHTHVMNECVRELHQTFGLPVL